jgi:hypothetical protein
MMRRIAVGAALLVLGLLFVLIGLAMIVRDWHGPIPFLLGGSAMWVLLRLDPDRLKEELEFLQAGLPIIAFAVFSLMVDHNSGTVGFDGVAAQIIVVLLLVLAIDARFFRLRKDHDRFDRAATLFTMILLGAGEYYALQSLIENHPRHTEMVAGAIAAGFVAVAVTALLGPSAARERERRDPRPPA